MDPHAGDTLTATLHQILIPPRYSWELSGQAVERDIYATYLRN
jgi:hypothetical protein